MAIHEIKKKDLPLAVFVTYFALLEHSVVICNDQQLTARRGEIASPEYPKKYPQNSRCDWTIAVDRGYQITLTFTQVNMFIGCKSLSDYYSP